ncbi:MAG: polysaccharide deacetylase family protein [Chloroflexota bacterium]|nr:MAG: polysaccharide deacetylase family protein [Chloroflexota bacterium]
MSATRECLRSAIAVAVFASVCLLATAESTLAASAPDALAEAYIALGGRDAIGPILGPAFRRPDDDGLYLAATGAILRVDPSGDAAPAAVSVWFSEARLDPWLESARGVPPPLPADQRLALGAVEQARDALLSQPEIRATYHASGAEMAARRWGEPLSAPRRFGPFIAQRFERGVLQLWVDEVAGAPAPGSVTAVLIGDLLVEAGLLPIAPRPTLPASVRAGDVLSQVEPVDGAVAITFDLGSVDTGLRSVLETLGERGLRATFFVTGDFTRYYEWAIPAIVAAGHEIANHTDTHPDLTRFGARRIADELDRLDATVAARGAAPPVWFRPPFGAFDARTRSLLSIRGFPLVMWRLDLGDWRDDISVQDVIAIGQRIRAGDIVVTHGGLAKTAAALPWVLDGIAERGLRQRTLSELYAP